MFHGSEGGQAPGQSVVGVTVTPDGGGYWIAAKDGESFSFGDAPDYQNGRSGSPPEVAAITPPP